MTRSLLATCCLVLAMTAPSSPAGASAVTAATEAYQRGDYATAFAALRPFADEGYDSACVILGRMYLDGTGVARDAGMAARYLKLASDRGSASASSALAELYSTGEGVPIDPAEAINLWRRAGHLGDPFAARRLGLELVRGVDVPQDKPLALLWLDAALEHLGTASEALRAGFVHDRDELKNALAPTELASAARLVSPEGPTPRAVIRDEAALVERAGTLYPSELRRKGGQGSVVVLLLVAADGHVGDVRLECSSGIPAFDAATLKLMRSASIEPGRVNGEAAAAWQVVKWTWSVKG